MDSNTTFAKATNSTNATGIAPVPQLPARSYQVHIVSIVFFCVLALMIVFGNSLVIGAFRVNRRLRTRSNMLLMSLAAADILIGTISVPMYVYVSVTCNCHGPMADIYRTFDIICGVSSILGLTAISLERCYALIYPLKHRNISKRTVLAIIFVVWVLASLAGSMLEFLPWEQKHFYSVMVTVAFLFVPLIVILTAYGTIFHIARAHARGRGISSFKKDLRIATTVAVVAGLFVICWTPFFGISFAFAVCITKNFASAGCAGIMKTPPVFLRISKWLQYGNSMCNPIVYGLRNQEFRQTFLKILLGFCCKKARLSFNRNDANCSPHIQRQSPNQLVLSTAIDRRESNWREFVIQSRRIESVRFELPDALQGVPPANGLSTCPVEPCNPAFEDYENEIGMYRHDPDFCETRL